MKILHLRFRGWMFKNRQRWMDTDAILSQQSTTDWEDNQEIQNYKKNKEDSRLSVVFSLLKTTATKSNSETQAFADFIAKKKMEKYTCLKENFPGGNAS